MGASAGEVSTGRLRAHPAGVDVLQRPVGDTHLIERMRSKTLAAGAWKVTLLAGGAALLVAAAIAPAYRQAAEEFAC